MAYQDWNIGPDDPLFTLIESAETVGHLGQFVLKEGLTPDGRPMLIVVAVGDGVPVLHGLLPPSMPA